MQLNQLKVCLSRWTNNVEECNFVFVEALAPPSLLPSFHPCFAAFNLAEQIETFFAQKWKFQLIQNNSHLLGHPQSGPLLSNFFDLGSRLITRKKLLNFFQLKLSRIIVRWSICINLDAHIDTVCWWLLLAVALFKGSGGQGILPKHFKHKICQLHF